MSDIQTKSRSFLDDVLLKNNFKLADASEEYKQRRKRQMLLFFSSASLTILASRFAYRATLSRQYVPTLFQGNHMPPQSYNFTMDAAVAVGTGTLLCGSVASMITFGFCWVADVSSFKEFGWKMNTILGGYDKQKLLSQIPMDDESATIQDGINDLLEGRYDSKEENDK